MDFLYEGIALGIDLIILGTCLKEYFGYKYQIELLKAARQYGINENLKSIVRNEPNLRIPYCVIRGTVTPIHEPMRSILSPSVTGVLQIVKLNEHRVARGFVGLWTEQKKLIHVACNDIPFELRNGDVGVEVVDALSAAVLDLKVVYENYEPSSLSFVDHILGFFAGVRQKGFQTTEEFLRDGSVITGVGELELDGDTLRLQPSHIGPLILTTATKANLIKRYEQEKSSMLIKVLVFGSLTALLVTIFAKKYMKRKRERSNQRPPDAIRPPRLRSLPAPTDPHCVVCITNPKEIILLPCGHVCLCEDCANRINDKCPICRADISSKRAAFIS